MQIKIKRYSDRKNRNWRRIVTEVEEFSSFFPICVPQHLSMDSSALVSERFAYLIDILAVIIFPSPSIIHQNIAYFSVYFQAFLRTGARCLAMLFLSCSISQIRDSRLDSVVFSKHMLVVVQTASKDFKTVGWMFSPILETDSQLV